jgi:hypothetical protein
MVSNDWKTLGFFDSPAKTFAILLKRNSCANEIQAALKKFKSTI